MNVRPGYIVVALLALACESRKDPTPNALAEIASSKPTLMGARPSEVTPQPAAPAKPIIRRPSGEEDLILTEERRAAIEKAFPEAKGFLVARDIERELFKQSFRRGKEAGAVKAFDARAKGQWVLFTGNVMSPTSEGFELPVRYTPRDPMDRVGLTSTWFAVQFRGVEGYDRASYEPGEMTGVLAKYEGARTVTSGHDLVLGNRWFGAHGGTAAR